MSTTPNSETVPPSTPVGMRPAWLWTGAVMWICVLGGLAFLWQLKQQQQQVLADVDRQQQTAQTVQTIPITTTINEQGEQVIDLSQLTNPTKPASAEPVWDPNGVVDFSFTNCDGRTITKADLLGKPWAICFVFTKCLGPCPTVTRQMKQLQDRLKDDDVRLVTLTVDPLRDTPEALLAYAKLNGADLDKWYFLNGDQHATYGLIHRSFQMPVQELQGNDRQFGYEFIHTTNVMLVDAQGVVQGKFNAAKDEDMARLRRELQRLAEPTSTTPVTAEPVAAGP